MKIFYMQVVFVAFIYQLTEEKAGPIWEVKCLVRPYPILRFMNPVWI